MELLLSSPIKSWTVLLSQSWCATIHVEYCQAGKLTQTSSLLVLLHGAKFITHRAELSRQPLRRSNWYCTTRIAHQNHLVSTANNPHTKSHHYRLVGQRSQTNKVNLIRHDILCMYVEMSTGLTVVIFLNIHEYRIVVHLELIQSCMTIIKNKNENWMLKIWKKSNSKISFKFSLLDLLTAWLKQNFFSAFN